MENISLKIESEFLKEIEEVMVRNNYMTKTEFIRGAIRDKLRKLEKEETLRAIDKIAGYSKRRTTDEQLHDAGKKAFEELERKFDLK